MFQDRFCEKLCVMWIEWSVPILYRRLSVLMFMKYREAKNSRNFREHFTLEYVASIWSSMRLKFFITNTNFRNSFLEKGHHFLLTISDSSIFYLSWSNFFHSSAKELAVSLSVSLKNKDFIRFSVSTYSTKAYK